MKKIFSLIVLFSFLVVSCTEDVAPVISVSVASANVGYDGGEVSTLVSSNFAWTATCDDDDIIFPESMSAGSNMVTVIVPPTESEITNSFKVTFTAKGESTTSSASLIITQAPAPYLEIDKTKASVPQAGGEVVVVVEANDSWTVDCTNPYLTIVPDKEGVGKTKVIITVPENTTGKEQRSTITFKSGPLTKELEIVQSK